MKNKKIILIIMSCLIFITTILCVLEISKRNRIYQNKDVKKCSVFRKSNTKTFFVNDQIYIFSRSRSYFRKKNFLLKINIKEEIFEQIPLPNKNFVIDMIFEPTEEMFYILSRDRKNNLILSSSDLKNVEQSEWEEMFNIPLDFSSFENVFSIKNYFILTNDKLLAVLSVKDKKVDTYNLDEIFPFIDEHQSSNNDHPAEYAIIDNFLYLICSSYGEWPGGIFRIPFDKFGKLDSNKSEIVLNDLYGVFDFGYSNDWIFCLYSPQTHYPEWLTRKEWYYVFKLNEIVYQNEFEVEGKSVSIESIRITDVVIADDYTPYIIYDEKFLYEVQGSTPVLLFENDYLKYSPKNLIRTDEYVIIGTEKKGVLVFDVKTGDFVTQITF